MHVLQETLKVKAEEVERRSEDLGSREKALQAKLDRVDDEMTF